MNFTARNKGKHWSVYYTSLQSFIITFSYSFACHLLGLLFYFDWLVLKVECPNVIPLIVIYTRGNFVHYDWG